MASRFRIDSRRWVARPRWRAWAAALLDRHLLRPTYLGGSGRVFLRPLGKPRSAVRERWLLASRTLQPQIHLAIQTVLRPRLWEPRPVLAAAGPAPGAEVHAERILHERVLRVLMEREAVSGPAQGATFAPADRARTAFASHAAAVRPGTTPPLQLVFQRLRAPERALGATPVTMVRPESVLARQVAAKVRRVEQQPPTVAPVAPARVMARREAPAPDASSAPSAAPRGSGPVQGFWNGSASGMPAAPQPAMPAVNVEDLADRVMRQIDHRLHAWRERTGF